MRWSTPWKPCSSRSANGAAGQFVARISERAHEGVVGVLDAAVRFGDQDHVLRLFGGGRQEAQPGVDALELAGLQTQTEREESEAGDSEQRREQRAERVTGSAERLQPEREIADDRDQQHRHGRPERRQQRAGGVQALGVPGGSGCGPGDQA